MQQAEVLGLLVIGNRCHVSDSKSSVQVLFLYFAFMETAWTLCPTAVSEWRFRQDLKGLCTNTILEFKASSSHKSPRERGNFKGYWIKTIVFYFFFFFWPCCMAYGMLFPWPGIKPTTPCWELSPTPAVPNPIQTHRYYNLHINFPKVNVYIYFVLYIYIHTHTYTKSLQLCPTLCEPMDCSWPGYCVHGILLGKNTGVLPCPPPGDLRDPGINPASLTSPALAGRFFTTSAIGEVIYIYI